MKSKMTKQVFKAHVIPLLLILVVLVTAIPKTTMAKSLFMIADKGFLGQATQPLHIYNIGTNGTLMFQAQHEIPHIMLGAVGLAIDSDNGYMFVTYEASEEVQVLEVENMTDVGSLVAPDAVDLAGIAFDHEKSLVYCVDRGESNLYIYQWDPETATLSHSPDSPAQLYATTGYGIALDEIDDLLYVTNASKKVNVYKTSNWQKVDRISLTREAISVAIDPVRGLLYTGAGYAGDKFLVQYNLATDTIKEVQVDPEAGVIGLSVDSDTGYVYLTTGLDNEPGGDKLQAYDVDLNLIEEIAIDGSPTDLVIPTRDISFNPLDLQKTIVRGASSSGSTGEIPTVGIGDIITYGIHFNNFTGDTVTDISIVDTLPSELAFVSADDQGTSGSYDPKTHAFTWTYSSWPPEIPTTLELVVQVKDDVKTGALISNSVTINSNQTPPTTKRLDVVAGHNPLNLTKVILGSAQGEVTAVESDSAVTYVIEFKNDNDFVVSNIVVLDTLPKEITFVSADKGTVRGKYDPQTHTCLWTLASLKTGQSAKLELEARINKDLAKGTMFTNTVTVENVETPPSVAAAEAIVGDTASTAPRLQVLPEIIRRDGTSYDIQASIIFEEQDGIGIDDIADVLPSLYDLSDPKSLGVKAKQMFKYGSDSRSKVIALFDKNEFLEAVEGYGEIKLQMVGMLTSGRSYSAEGTVTITQYSGG